MDKSDPPGFVRIEGETGRVFYFTSPNPLQPGQKLRKLYNAAQVAQYLKSASIRGVEVEGSG